MIVLWMFFNIPQIEWEKIYGNQGIIERTKDVIPTQDRGFMILASKSYDIIYLMKTDSLGNILWESFIEKNDTSLRSEAIIQTPDGGYFIVGDAYAKDIGGVDSYVAKLNSNGSVVWEKVFHPGEEKHGSSAYSVRYIDNGYIIIGSTRRPYVVKMDEDGNVVWERFFEYRAGEGCPEICITQDGNCLGVWEVYTEDMCTQILMVKLTPDGEVLWEKNIGGEYSFEEPYDVDTTKDNGVVIGGRVFVDTTGMEFYGYLVKTDASGNVIWERKFFERTIYSVALAQDDGYLVMVISDRPLIKVNSEGYLVWKKRFSQNIDSRLIIEQTEDMGHIIAGTTIGEEDIYLIKLSPEFPGVEEVSPGFYIKNVIEKNRMVLYVNGTAELYLYDVTGRLIKKAMLSCGKNEVEIKESSGVYFYFVKDKKEVKKGKVIIF